MIDLAASQHVCSHISIKVLTVYALRIGKGLPLLSLVPFYDESVAEGEGGAGIGGSGIMDQQELG